MMTKPPIRLLLLSALIALDAAGLTPPTAETASLIPESVTERNASRSRTHFAKIDFPGGSIAELVTLLGNLEGGAFNLIEEPANQAVQLPPFSLRNVDINSLTQALNRFLHPSNLSLGFAGSNIFVLTKSASPSRLLTTVTPNFQSFQVGACLDTLSVEDIIDAVRSAWEFEAGHDPKSLHFKYHPATKLLFVYGPPEAIAVANQVIPQLAPASARAGGALSLQAENARLQGWQQEIERRRTQRAGTKAAPPKTPSETK